MPTPLEAIYGASKAFILSFASAVRNELKGTGVTITALLPGPTDTNFFHRAGMDDTLAGSVEMKKNSAADVARQGFDAMMAGKDRIVGASAFSTKIEGLVGKFLPEDYMAKKHQKLAEHGAAKR
jgi:short-subunit dehydrogenase